MIKLYNEGCSMSYIGRVFKISRQRVHQIVKDYRSFAQSGRSFKNYKSLNTKYCRGCSYYDAIVVHHVDGNSKNNEEINLMPLCQSCHTSIHNGRL